MKFRFYIFLLMGMMLSLSLSAQQVILQGKVSDAYSGKGLQGVVVTIRPEGGNRILKFAKTQADGGYQLKLTAMPEGKNVLHFSMMGYATKTMPLEEGKTEYDVLLTEQATKLKEVMVKAPSIRQRGDTIAYNVASFADANDKSLADVLKKMPGMEVSDNGEIKYNGKAINKFYIEGHDMLGGRYSIATNNIHQKDVGTVEVMTNHQPIKALEDMSFSQDPAITLTSNGEKSYITNRLSTNLSWNDVMMDISGTYPNHQLGKMPRYQVSDKFELLRRSGERAFTFSTNNAYLVNPQSLSLTRYAEAYQSVRSAAFFSHTYTSLGFYLKPFTVTMKVGLQVLNRTMKSHLDGISLEGDGASEQQQQGVLADMGMLRNDLSMTYVRVYASPEAEFNQGGWHIRFQMPIAYTPYYYRNHLGDDAYHSSENTSSDDWKQDAYKAQVSPQLSVSYYLTPRLQATLSGGISQREVDEQNFYQGLILCDSRLALCQCLCSQELG